MAINRAPFNALVDDDGSGLTGSVWNKAAIQSVLLDPIDAMIVGGVKPIVIASTTTGVQNAWAPGIADDTVINWAGATDLTLNGLAGAAVGRRVTIKNLAGGGNIYIAHSSGSAAANCGLYNAVGSGPTPIGPNGWASYVSRGDIWILVAHEQGGWITPPFSASNFGGTGSMSVTIAAGNVLGNRYRVSGRTLHWALFLQSVSIGAPLSGAIRATLPNGYSGVYFSAAYPTGLYRLLDNGAATVGLAMMTVGTAVDYQRLDNAALQASGANTQVLAQITLELT